MDSSLLLLGKKDFSYSENREVNLQNTLAYMSSSDSHNVPVRQVLDEH